MYTHFYFTGKLLVVSGQDRPIGSVTTALDDLCSERTGTSTAEQHCSKAVLRTASKYKHISSNKD